MLSLAKFSAIQKTSCLSKWLETCPDPRAMNEAVQRFMQQVQHETWLSENQTCDECGEKPQRSEMRWDDSGLFGAETHLICRCCWNFSNEAPLGGLGKWPEEMPEMFIQDCREMEELPILLDGQIIGHVESYSRKTHSGIVTLNAFPKDTEHGPLMPHWTVPDPDQIEQD